MKSNWILTNKHNWPQPIFDAWVNDVYDGYDSDYTPTSLNYPPYMKWLLDNCTIEVDISQCFWMLRGQAMHTILERANGVGYVKERRLYTKINNLVISGKFDVYYPDSGLIQDYKDTKVTGAQKVKRDHINQLNILAYLARLNKLDVKKLEIVALLGDWNPHKLALRDYPRTAVKVLSVDLWTHKYCKTFLEEKIALHEEIKMVKSIDNVKPCSAEERWSDPEIWAVKPKGRKSAVRCGLKYTKDEAEEMADELSNIENKKGKIIKHIVEYRPPRQKRCERYCFASSVCPEWSK